jgi:hypothetical protein
MPTDRADWARRLAEGSPGITALEPVEQRMRASLLHCRTKPSARHQSRDSEIKSFASETCPRIRSGGLAEHASNFKGSGNTAEGISITNSKSPSCHGGRLVSHEVTDVSEDYCILCPPSVTTSSSIYGHRSV